MKGVCFVPRIYKMSADVREKEKVVGGVLTIQQTCWLAGGCAIFALLLSLFCFKLHWPAIVSILLAAPPGLSFGLIFAFYKKGELTLTQYLMLKHQFKSKEKVLLNTLHYREPKQSLKEEEKQN